MNWGVWRLWECCKPDVAELWLGKCCRLKGVAIVLEARVL